MASMLKEFARAATHGQEIAALTRRVCFELPASESRAVHFVERIREEGYPRMTIHRLGVHGITSLVARIARRSVERTWLLPSSVRIRMNTPMAPGPPSR